MPLRHSNIFRFTAVAIALGLPLTAFALNTATITSSSLSPDCLTYRVVGICYWLFCTNFGCEVETSSKVRHYVPDAVVSSYSNTGENPWTDVRAMSAANPTALGGGDGSAGISHEGDLAKFKNADVIGHPGGATFSQFVSQSGYGCPGAGKILMPYFLSTLDSIAWRYNIPELVFPESLTPGVREIGSRTSGDLWGSIYPRGGFLHGVDDYKSAAVVAQRAGDIVTRRGQMHVYQPLLGSAQDGYWPAGPLEESDPSTGKWQELAPSLAKACVVFPNKLQHIQSPRADYAWALWRPYSCCERKGQIFLGSTDYAGASE
ncbi:TIGR03756 family integrating conjugative element protein [Pseudomonas bijieensis]|uniref:TIGR03756 family integrating conjugative element protein n=1 Tax=Pseudomonas bijieensis TaxID=2681983 RepID=UPI00200F2ADF|nr:TIGR03756 family integrating conjugative element protein [Pseudomonas bijieensis]UQI28506.1 TIGR03756 family integrating conjugative element protein [Pseudomonas bijieensis]